MKTERRTETKMLFSKKTETPAVALTSTPSPTSVAKAKPKYEIVDVSEKVFTGTCRWFNGAYGFAVVSDVSDDVFLHKSQLHRDDKGLLIEPVNETGRVKFRLGKRSDDKTKLVAVDIEVIDRYVPMKKAKAA